MPVNNEKLKILIVGSYAREHSVGWKVSQSPMTGEIFFAPGNGGTHAIGTNVDIAATDIPKLFEFAQKEKIDLTLALSDDPLALGIVDTFQEASLRIWGPRKNAAEIEWSKVFSKDFMKRHGLPTAKFEVFNDFEQAKAYVESQPLPIVIKADGLALGKGVVIANTKEEAVQALENIMVKKIFGESGNRVIIEEFLTGPEISIHVFSDGKNYKMFPASQDHKKIGEGNTGPNTGGIGVVSPLPYVDEKLLKNIEESIVAPTIKGMADEGRPFVGVLYPGLILTPNGPRLLEFNSRFGDPEAEVYMRLLENDLLEIILASLDGRLNEVEVKWKNLAACNIFLCSKGYPGTYEKGKVISGVEEAAKEKDIVIFHAGTKLDNGKFVTNGGRVLGVSATGESLEISLEKAYKAIEQISFEGMYYRRDIGKY